MAEPIRILATVRDPGSAANLAPVLSALQEDHRFAPTVCAQEPGATGLAASGHEAEIIDETDDLCAIARRQLARHRPDVVLVTTSSIGVGIDEAVLSVASDRPRYALQCYWGEVNAIDGCYADHYFTIDEEAAAITRRRTRREASVIGWPKYREYDELDAAGLRARTREEIQVKSDEQLVGLFSQTRALPGYEDAIAGFAEAVQALDRPVRILLRAHPKFSDEQAWHRQCLAALGPVIDVTGHDRVEPWLAACDVAATTFSTCAVDHGQLAARTDTALGQVLHLMVNDRLRQAFRDESGLDDLPGQLTEVGHIARSRSEILPKLRAALRPATTCARRLDSDIEALLDRLARLPALS